MIPRQSNLLLSRKRYISLSYDAKRLVGPEHPCTRLIVG
jgi:hypothetical protein